jgi:hypothetical protein
VHNNNTIVEDMHLIQIITCISRDTCTHRTAIFMMAVIFFYKNIQILKYENNLFWTIHHSIKFLKKGQHIQYWCIDGKYRIYVARFRNKEKTSFSELFHSFRAKPHKFYIYCQYTVFILQYLQKKKFFNLIITKDNGTPLIPQ